MTLASAFRLADELLAQSAVAETRVERTRLKLLASAATLLDEVPFMQIRPADLAAHADVSRALIYHRFTDLAGLVTELMAAFELRVVKDLKTIATEQKKFNYESLVESLAWTFSAFMRNRGIMRLLLSHADQVPGVDAIVERTLHAFNKVLGDSVVSPSSIPLNPRSRLIVGYIIGGGVSDLLRRMLNQGHDHLPVPQTKTEMFEIVQLMAFVRHREMNGRDPTAKEIRDVVRSFDLKVFQSYPTYTGSITSDPYPTHAMQRLRLMAAKVPRMK